MNLLAFLLSGALVASASAEFFTIRNLVSKDGKATIESSLDGGKRKLALDTGSFSSTNVTTDTCQLMGSRILCSFNATITSEDFSTSSVDVLVACPLDSQDEFDFRRAVGCACGVEIMPSGGKAKFCPCAVCPMGFGEAPISIDCTNPTPVDPEDAGAVTPFVIDKCTSLDCGFNCNGTCLSDCQKSGPSCSFCTGSSSRTTLETTELITSATSGPILETTTTKSTAAATESTAASTELTATTETAKSTTATTTAATETVAATTAATETAPTEPSGGSKPLSWACCFFVALVAGAAFMF